MARQTVERIRGRLDPGTAALAGAPAGAQAPVGTDREVAEWNAARGAGAVEACQHDLELDPLGRYSGAAFRDIIGLTIDLDAIVAGLAAGPEGSPASAPVGSASTGIDKGEGTRCAAASLAWS